MQVFISADMEGITGIVSREQLIPDGKDYQQGRALMAGDVNAAIAGALSVADSVVVSDGHNTMTNIELDKLDPRARLISGTGRPLSMVQGVEGSQVAFFVGYHAYMGSADAIFDHSYSSRLISRIRLNGQQVGETGMNAALAGHFGVPVGLVTGDTAVCAEACSLLGDIETAVVKQAIGRNCADCLPIAAALDLIEGQAKRAAERAKNGEFGPFEVELPATVEVEFLTSQMASRASILPYANRTEARTITYISDDLLQAYQSLLCLMMMARG